MYSIFETNEYAHKKYLAKTPQETTIFIYLFTSKLDNVAEKYQKLLTFFEGQIF